jgi:hypothetical protein
MQVIIVITDVEDEYQEEKNGQVAYSVFEKPQLHEKGLDIQWSPAMQIGATLSAFLRMIEENHALLETMHVFHEFKEKYTNKDDYRYSITEKDGNVIHVDLKKIKPKGSA